MTQFLRGDKLYLRSITAEDASDRYLSWINDPEVTKGLVTGTHPSEMSALRAYIQQCIEQRDTIMLAICAQENDLHIGNIKLDRFDHVARTAELGIMIGDADYWGKGYGSEACKLVLEYARAGLNLRKVSLTVFSNNPAAIKLYEKLGFEREGTLKKHIYADGDYHDKVWMSYFLT